MSSEVSRARGTWWGSGLARSAAVLVVVAVAAACSSSQPKAAPPHSVAALQPCGLLTAAELTKLSLGPGAPATGEPRQCQYIATVGDDPGAAGGTGGTLVGLNVTLRDDAAANSIADARRMAQVYGAEHGATATSFTAAGRTVYQVAFGSAPGGVCSLLLTVDATSSVELQTSWAQGQPTQPGCGLGTVPQEVSALLPTPDNGYQTPASNRPQTLADLSACALISPARRAELHLSGDGQPVGGSSLPSCEFSSDATDPGAVVSVVVSGVGFNVQEASKNAAADTPKLADSGVTDYGPTLQALDGRTAYQVLGVIGPGPGAQSTCAIWVEVTQAETVEADVGVLGTSPAPACRVLGELEPEIEAGLPLFAP